METQIQKEAGYSLYYLGKDGYVYGRNPKTGRKKRFSKAAVARQAGHLYYIDKSGRVRSSLMKRRRK